MPIPAPYKPDLMLITICVYVATTSYAPDMVLLVLPLARNTEESGIGTALAV